jgi:lysozyme
MAFPAGCIPGVDVSHYNGTVNWTAAAAAGEVFAYMKASEATSTDAYFVDNWRSSKTAGLLRGAYHFLRPEVDATQQAKTFLQQLALANGSAKLNPGDLPAALDIEVSDGVSADAIVAAATTWLTAVEAATGRAPVIYTFTNFWIVSVEHVASFSRYPLWIAEYGVPAPKAIPATWPSWTIWQYAVQVAPWLSGQVDCDAFRGDLASLQALAGITPANNAP